MQAVFQTSQQSVQYPRYSSEHETKAAAAETFSQQTAVHLLLKTGITDSSTQLSEARWNVASTRSLNQKNTDFPLKSNLEISRWKRKLLKHMQAFHQTPNASAVLRQSAERVMYLCSCKIHDWFQVFWTDCPEIKESESIFDWEDFREVCSQITAEQNVEQLKMKELFYHAWDTLPIMFWQSTAKILRSKNEVSDKLKPSWWVWVSSETQKNIGAEKAARCDRSDTSLSSVCDPSFLYH